MICIYFLKPWNPEQKEKMKLTYIFSKISPVQFRFLLIFLIIRKVKKEIQLWGFQHCITLKNMPSGSDISEMCICIVCIFFFRKMTESKITDTKKHTEAVSLMYYLEYFLCLKNTAPRNHPFYTKICLHIYKNLNFLFSVRSIFIFFLFIQCKNHNYKIQSKIGSMQINVRNSNKCIHTLNKCNLNWLCLHN